MRTKLAHLCFETDDLEKTEAFYQVLGLTRKFEFRNLQGELVGFYLAFDDRSFIEVIKSNKPQQEGRIKHFAIEVDDVDEAHRRLVANSIEVSDKVLAKDHQWMVSTKDPNGIFVEIQQYTPQSMQLVGGVCEVDYQP